MESILNLSDSQTVFLKHYSKWLPKGMAVCSRGSNESYGGYVMMAVAVVMFLVVVEVWMRVG